MATIQKIISLALLSLVSASSSSSRPVRSDSEVFRALEWTIHEPGYFYGNTSGTLEKDTLRYHTRQEIEENEVHISGDTSTSTLAQIGHGNSKCPLELELLWSTKLGSSIYSSPITRHSMFGDGGVQIVAPTFVRYLELIEGSEGLAPTGWPLAFDIEDRQNRKNANGFDDDDFLYDDITQSEDMKAKKNRKRNKFQNMKKGPSIFHGSPAVHDVNGDGIDDILIADGDGNLYWVAVGSYGKYLHDYRISVPKLRIRKDWYENLDLDYTDRYVELSMFHHHGSGDGDDDIPNERIGEDLYGGGVDDVVILNNNQKQLKRGKEAETLAGHSTERRLENNKKKTTYMMEDNGNYNNRRSLLSTEEEGEGEEEAQIDFGEGGLPVYDDLYENYGLKGGQSFDDHYGSLGYGHDDEYGGGRKSGSAYGDHNYNQSEWVFVDAHILSTPTVADIDGDGHVEILVSVSYFFDMVDGHSAPEGVNPHKYVAGGVVCYDLQAQEWVWKIHLDLTTDEGKYKAYIFAAPSVGDLDGDGSAEVVIGTGLGLLYVLDAESGFVLKGFPLQMGEIQGQAALADVVVNDGTGDLEILVADMSGNLLCVNREGEVIDVLWDRQFPGSSSATPTVGDVNGDGFLDVSLMVTTKNGAALLYVVNGEDGEDLAHFPIRLLSKNQDKLTPPVLLVDLHGSSAGISDPKPNYKNHNINQFIEESKKELKIKQNQNKSEYHHYIQMKKHKKGLLKMKKSDGFQNEEMNKENIKLRGGGGGEVDEVSGPAPLGGWFSGLHLVVPTSDGKLHVVEGGSGCLNHVDIGEHMYAMTLAEDVQGDGLLDLVVSTMNGELMALGTSVPYHPLNSWGSMPNLGGRNGFTHGKHFGVFLYDMGGLREVSEGSTDVFEVSGRFITITFEIVDKRILFHPDDDDEDDKVEKEESKKKTIIGDDDEMLRDSIHQRQKMKNHGGGETKYSVSLSLGSNNINPIYKSTFYTPGIYSIEIELPDPMLAVIHLLVVNEHGQSATTSFTVAYNMNAFDIMKYLVLLPFLIAAIPLILSPEKKWKVKTNDLPN